MKEPFVFLCPEITRENALKLIKWLKDKEVTKYLSDPQDVSNSIEQVVQTTNLPVLTHLFNRNGRFYMVYNKHNIPVGFVRLVKRDSDYEIVIVIGDRNNWGKKLGTSAIKESIKIAFFEFRAQKVIANIQKENKRSINAFINNGFKVEKESNAFKTFSITMDQYLTSIKRNAVQGPRIYITKTDMERIKKFLESNLHREKVPDKFIRDLENEINRATIVESKHISSDIVTMNSRVLLHLEGDEKEVSLVYPQDADQNKNNLSVFSPIGTAILGYSEGSVIEWEVPSGIMKIHIKKILYQPEAAGDYHM
ncbi:MAG: nucleoside diphosphate kinase regulator [Clostridia bacterium]|nr:nucleoside diphosphate kinase regulator [Clostridia bacterium]